MFRRGDQEIRASEDSVINVSRVTVAVATGREEADNISSHFRWTLADYCCERGCVTNVFRFTAKVVDGKNLVLYKQNNF